ncbi:MAG: helix-turn-helix domain-containing protein [Vicinamibacteria bacterium]|nr:helix-turn-helix domain-containing protein [Vicinamibacteria bacterium]
MQPKRREADGTGDEEKRSPSGESYRWLSVPRWYLWEGGFLLLGRGTGVVPPHAHHAIQIVVALEGRMVVCGRDQKWREACGIVVQPDVTHSFDCRGASAAMLFVDPESSEGAWLRASLRDDITVVPEARLASCVWEIRAFMEKPFESMDVQTLIRHCVQELSPGAPPLRRLDPRVTDVLAAIRKSDDLRISLASAAKLAFLSPSRFAHLFKQQMGLPFSRYMLWRKLTRAMVAIAAERTIAAAAHAADFADAAHLTRTFYQMVGMAPSALMYGEFAQIAPPFDPSGESRPAPR